MAKPAIEKRDKRWIADMYEEIEEEVRHRPDPATKHITCTCGHTLAKHYMGTQAMPCSKCNCMFCKCEAAERLRKDRARKGVKDMTPMSRLFRGGR